MDIISRKEAKVKGLTKYYTGEPCKRGHIVPRWTATYGCVICTLITRKENPNTAKYQAEYKERNKDQILESNRRYRKLNPDRHRDWVTKNRSRFLSIIKAHKVIRHRLIAAQRIAKTHAKETATIYQNCPPGYNVDHIVPLRGKLVTGLHVPWNLQYLPALDNNKKRNHFEG